MTTPSSFTQQDYELIKREVLYQGFHCFARYHLRFRLFNGGWSNIVTREVLERFSAAAVIPYDPSLDRVLLIEQFRPGSLAEPNGPWIIEVPAGIFSANETPAELARREAKEEAGCVITDLELINEYFVSPSCATEYMHLFYGQVDASHAGGIFGLKEENEDIRVLNLPAEEAFALLRAGKVKTSPAIIGLLWLELNRQRLRNKLTRSSL